MFHSEVGNMLSIYTSLWLCLLVALAVTANPVNNRGTFWHISDLHYDPTPEGKSCVKRVSDVPTWGSEYCDSTFKLISSAVDAMKEIDSNADFVLWTGDTVLHYLNGTVGTKEEVVNIMKSMSDLLNAAFPDKHVVASLGNHDYVPDNQLPATENEIYTNISQIWDTNGWFDGIIGDSDSFKKYGFYSVKLPSGLIAVALNTNFYYRGNKVFESLEVEDPGQQFATLRALLKEAKENSSKVLVSAHVPFGVGALGDYKHMFEKYNADFLSVIRDYHDVIVGPFFGHEHNDAFKLVFDNKGENVISRAFMAPSITPWRYKRNDVISTYHNPGIRLVTYDTKTFDIIDYVQYYLDFSSTSEGTEPTNWTELYRFTSAYDVPDASIDSVTKAAEKVRSGKKLTEYQQAYYCKKDVADCDSKCRAGLSCAIFEVDHDEAAKCVYAINPTTVKPTTDSGALRGQGCSLMIAIVILISLFTN